MTEPTVFVVDDEPDIQDLLREYFEQAGLKVHISTSAAEFLAAYDRNIRGCILLDIGMPGMNGIELLDVLNGLGNKTPVIFLTGAGTIENAVNALKSGAIDFIEKPMVMRELLGSVRRAMEFDLQNRYEHSQSIELDQRFAQLTPRESEVMSWITQGKSNKKIALILDISSRTVEIHRAHILEKMKADSIVDLVKMSIIIKN